MTNDPFPDFGLGGSSLVAPAIAGDDIYGLAVVWAQQGSVMLSVGTGSDWSSAIPIPGAQTFYSPGIAMAYDWFDIAIVWTDTTGQVNLQLATSPGSSVPLSGPDAAAGAPAIVYAEGTLFVAWMSQTGSLVITSYTPNGQGPTVPDFEVEISSPPGLCWYEGQLYIGVGGTMDQPAAMSIFTSPDGGASVYPYEGGPNYVTTAAPSMVVQDGVYCLAYSDESFSLNIIQTDDLTNCTNQSFPIGCHGGGASVALSMGQLDVAWTYGLPPEDPRSHEVFVGYIPVTPALQRTPLARERFAQVGAQVKCPGGSVWDPQSQTCVSSMSCVGQCVINCMGANGLLNPITFAYCLWKNC